MKNHQIQTHSQTKNVTVIKGPGLVTDKNQVIKLNVILGQRGK